MSQGRDSSIPMAMLFVVMLYILVGQFLKANKIHILGETSFGILAGMIVGGIFKLADTDKYHALVNIVVFILKFSLDPDTFFFILLPVIIFAGAYNLKKKKFLHNFKYIILFGFISTLLNYIITVTLTIGLNATGIVKVENGDGTFVSLTVKQIMLQSATICATDSVAAITLISSDTYPQLFSVVFGEGMVNDAVSIILYKAIEEMFESTNIILVWYTPFLLIWKFIKNCVLSLFVGITIGLLSTLIFKRFRFLSYSTTSETVFAFLMAYMGYGLCEIFQLSGVIGLLMCGIIMSHYQTYNISNLAKVTTRITFDSIALLAEAFIYVYLGFTVWDQTNHFSVKENTLIPVDVNYLFTLFQGIIVVLARFLSIYIVYWITILFQGSESWKLSSSELAITCFAGMVRGSVAFALIETLSYDQNNQTEINQINIIQSSVLYIVVSTTLIFGTSMPFFIHYQQKKQINNQPQEPLNLTDTSSDLQSPSLVDSPLLVDNASKTQSKILSEAQKIIKYLDEHYFKRWFIYNYEERKKQILDIKRDIKKRDLQEIYNEAISEIDDDDNINRFRIIVDESEKMQPIEDSYELSQEWTKIPQ